MIRVAALAAAVALIPAPAHAKGADLRLSYTVPPGESGPTAHDSSSYHNNGVLKGGVTRRYGAYRFHRLGGDLSHFDRIVAPDSPSLSTGTLPFAYSVRVKVKPDARWENTQMAVMRHGDHQHGFGANYKLELVRSSTGLVGAMCVMHSQGPGAAYIRGRGSLATIADGRWHTITCARLTSGDIALSVDRSTRTRTPKVPLTDMTGQAKLLIGCQRQGGRFIEQFVGKMDDVTITAGS